MRLHCFLFRNFCSHLHLNQKSKQLSSKAVKKNAIYGSPSGRVFINGCNNENNGTVGNLAYRLTAGRWINMACLLEETRLAL